MLLPLLAVIGGILVLVVGADRFVLGAADLARHLGLPSLLIGIVIIGFGTSVPEMLVSATGAMQGATGIALGNAYGSNITNILLILGLSSLINPLKVTHEASRREMPILLFVTAVTVALLWDGEITRLDAVIMLVVFAGCMVVTVRQSLKTRPSSPMEPAAEEDASSGDGKPRKILSPGTAVFWIVVGLGLMLASSAALVWGATTIARQFGVDELIIGLTIVAVGTSLPELASSIAASRRGEDDLALGNILGSNTFNSMVVVGIAGVIRPLTAEPELLTRDLPVMAGATVLLFAFSILRPSPGRISRVEGALFLALYVGYTLYLIKDAAV